MEPLTHAPQPLKRHTALQPYSRDHHFGLLLAWKIRKGLDKAIERQRISDYVLFSFQSELLPHFRDEEKFLLTQLAANDAFAQRTSQEHAKIESLVSNWKEIVPNEAALFQFADLLDAHIRFEERELFTHLQEQLSADSLKALEAIERSTRQDVDSIWPDHFWLDNKTESDN